VLRTAMLWSGVASLGLQGSAVWLGLVCKLLLAVRVRKRVAHAVEVFEVVLQQDPALRAALQEAQAAGRPLVLPRGICAEKWVAGATAGSLLATCPPVLDLLAAAAAAAAFPVTTGT
jgi:hypothetical protein